MYPSLGATENRRGSMDESWKEGAVPFTIAQLRRSLRELEAVCEEGGVPRIRHLLPENGSGAASPLPAMLRALPFLTPISLGPITAPASGVIGLCGVRLARIAHATALPARLLDLSIPAAVIRPMRGAGPFLG